MIDGGSEFQATLVLSFSPLTCCRVLQAKQGVRRACLARGRGEGFQVRLVPGFQVSAVNLVCASLFLALTALIG